MHLQSPVCASCHRLIDPIGFGFEKFDAIGGRHEKMLLTFRPGRKEKQTEPTTAELPLDTRGDFYDGTPVTTPAELTRALMKRPVPLVRTFTENLLAYALGRRAEYFDQPAIRAIAKAAEANDYRMSSFILGVIKSDAFQLKRAEPTATQ